VVFDDSDINSLEVLSNYHFPVMTCVKSTKNYSVGCWNEVHQIKGFDAHLMLSDDLELEYNCLKNLVNDMEVNFPDTDGVIGIPQDSENEQYRPSLSHMMIGEKFIERYTPRQRQVSCPFYYHFFQREELYEYAKLLRKFHHSSTAKLIPHNHLFNQDERDSTYALIKELYQKDVETFKTRQYEGKLWGREWEV
jgi:hypothetical protein